MLWRQLTTLGCFIILASVVFAAPPDTLSTSISENVVEEAQRMSLTEDSLLTSETLETTSRQLIEEANQETGSGKNTPNSVKSTKDNSEVFPQQESETQEVATQRDEPAGAILTLAQALTEKPPKEAATEQTNSEKPASEVVTQTQQAVSYTPATVVITRPTKKPTKKPKPVRATTAKPLVQSTSAVPAATVPPLPVSTPASVPTRRYPCLCGGGVCSCCTGILLENFNFPFRSRACANVSYEPDDFAFNLKLAYNDRVLYNTRMSAKNPPPACIPINRYFGIKMCAKLTNVFFSGRNAHACLEMEGFYDEEPAFNYPFNCFRIGSNGVAFVRPEDGGGLPPPPDEEEQTDEDYDDSARAWVGDVQTVPN